MLHILQFEEVEDRLAAELERTKSVSRIEVGFTRIEMGEDRLRPVGIHRELMTAAAR